MSLIDIKKSIEELKAEMRAGQAPASRDYAAEVKTIIEAFESICTVLWSDQPNLDTLTGLLARARSSDQAIARKMADAIRNGLVPRPFGSDLGAAKFREVFDALTFEVLEVARRSTAGLRVFADADANGGFYGRLTVEEPRVAFDWRTSGRDSAEILTLATAHLVQFLSAHPEMQEEIQPVLNQLLGLRLPAEGYDSGGQPPKGPVDTSSQPDDDGDMEPRILNLEKFADECRKDFRSIDVRLAKVETLADGIAKNMATKAELAELKGGLAQLEATLLKWFIGTAIALTGLAFGAAKLFH
jgi:hypothetical protein